MISDAILTPQKCKNDVRCVFIALLKIDETRSTRVEPAKAKSLLLVGSLSQVLKHSARKEFLGWSRFGESQS